MSPEFNKYVPPKKSFWERSYRPVIYVAAFVCVVIGISSNKSLKLNVSKTTKGLYDTVGNLPALRMQEIADVEAELVQLNQQEVATSDQQKKLNNQIFDLQEHLARLKMNTNGVLLMCLDFDPGTSPELQPMAEAILQHCFHKGIKVIGNVGYSVVSAQLANNIIEDCSTKGLDNNLPYPAMVNGTDYVFLGFRPNAFMIYLQMGEDIITAYETDYANNDLNNLPIMRGIKNFQEIDAVVSLTGYVGGPEMWMNVAKTKFNKKVGIGMTAVSSADYYPYVQSGQIVGLLSGLRGAAEYECAINCPGSGIDRMRPQLYVHTLALFLIILGNIEFFTSKFLKFFKQ